MNVNQTYPLGQTASNQIMASSGRKLSQITLDAVNNHTLTSEDLQVQAQTLQAQAQVAKASGYPQLAENLIRAAELTAVPNDELLTMYETLRPGRATYGEVMALAQRLEDSYSAPQNAKLVREAGDVYLARGLVRKA